MSDKDLISKNLKLVKIDIWVHSILLILGTLLPIILSLTGLLYFAEINTNCGTVGCWNRSTYSFFTALTVLFCSGCLAVFWQFISLFLSKKYKEIHSHKTKIIRKLFKIYYYLLIFSLIGYLIFIAIWSYYPSFSPFSTFFGFSLIILFLLSPFFWLVYYVNLFSQRKFLKSELDKISTVSK